MLNWSQDQLATNAAVSRATVADFETNTRRPMQNNMRSIADSMFAAGIEFLPEEGTKGVGVRFRERKLEYVGNVRINRFENSAAIKMRYAGEEFVCVIDLDAVDDHHRGNFSTDDQYSKAISDILHIVLAAAERHAPTKINNGRLLVTYDMLQNG
ncbi:helix-turn-helix transcriptional regulator [uncultured Tateyamaria sp.]|uniref:helix-turn-helix domain-containing protein n=1 Tax=uncultured Tateyamaria sp. TaxID=455651 RepID=UPI00344B8E5E